MANDITFSKEDVRVMQELTKEVHGDDKQACAEGLINLCDYARMVSNL